MDSSATSEEQLRSQALFLSPHLDDVVLSCGGTIHKLTQGGERVLIVTITAGDPPSGELSPFSLSLHARWQLAADAITARRLEDIEACRILGADWLHLQVPDCIYRRSSLDGRPLYDSEEALFGSIDTSEQALIADLARRFGLFSAEDPVYVPLAVGNHVDHQITRVAAEARWDTASLNYYEEYPYSAVEGRIESTFDDEGRWNADVVRLDAPDIEARLRAIACYRSQISTFFKDLEEMSDRIRQYVQIVGGERFWKWSG